MRIALCGNRLHFTSHHAVKLLKLSVLCLVIVIVIFFILSYTTVPYSNIIYDSDDYNKPQKGEMGYDLQRSAESQRDFHAQGQMTDRFHGSQDQLDYIASHLSVFIQPITNELGRFFYNVKLTNTGEQVIEGCCWTIYFYSSKMLDCPRISENFGLLSSLDRKMMLKDDSPSNVVRAFEESVYRFHTHHSFVVSHVTGYTFKMQPKRDDFRPILPNATRIIRFSGFGWAVSRSEFIPNWYVANDLKPSLLPRVLRSTAGERLEFVGDFSDESSKVRFKEDKFTPIMPEQRYEKNVVRRKKRPQVSLIPTPVGVKVQGSYKIIVSNSWSILYKEGLKNEAYYLRDKLSLRTVPKLLPSTSLDNSSLHNVIVLNLASERTRMRILSTLSLRSDKQDTEYKYHVDGGYELMVEPNKVQVSGLSPGGTFHGLVSLLNILEPVVPGNDWEAHSCRVVDAPRFEHRGLMIDVARNFFSIESIMKVVEVMALYKMNVLHLHLSDDEGWRLEIPGLPELTKVGGRRGHDPTERTMVMSLLGSDPEKNPNTGSGFYSVEEFRKFLRFATERHVTVIPEFDMPSHSHAAIVSMKARHRLHQNTTKDFLLSDLQDTSVYATGQFYSSSAINPCLKSTYRFVFKVLHHLTRIYQGVAPLKYFHLGGDEVPRDAYQDSPACQRLQANLLKKGALVSGGSALKAYFIENVARLAMRLNLSLIGWDDAFLKDDGTFMTFNNIRTDQDVSNIHDINNNNVKNKTVGGKDAKSPKQDIVAQYYYNIWEQGLASKPYVMANRGMKVILSAATALYFDSPQEPDPEDWGLHWASRYTDTKRTFYFTPSHLYNSIDYSFDGQEINKTIICARHPCRDLERPENILGIEAAMWSELVRTPERMHSMLFPRLLAVAERAWHQAIWEGEKVDKLRKTRRKRNWEQFAIILGTRELKRLEDLGISYYLPRPGVISTVSGLHVNTMFPGMRIQVSKDSGRTWNDYEEGQTLGPGKVLFSTSSFDGKRRSAPVEVTVGKDQ